MQVQYDFILVDSKYRPAVFVTLPLKHGKLQLVLITQSEQYDSDKKHDFWSLSKGNDFMQESVFYPVRVGEETNKQLAYTYWDEDAKCTESFEIDSYSNFSVINMDNNFEGDTFSIQKWLDIFTHSGYGWLEFQEFIVIPKLPVKKNVQVVVRTDLQGKLTGFNSTISHSNMTDVKAKNLWMRYCLKLQEKSTYPLLQFEIKLIEDTSLKYSGLLCSCDFKVQ